MRSSRNWTLGVGGEELSFRARYFIQKLPTYIFSLVSPGGDPLPRLAKGPGMRPLSGRYVLKSCVPNYVNSMRGTAIATAKGVKDL